MPTPYRIHKLFPPRRNVQGITHPVACTLHGILKFDCPDSPHLVYNEFAAMRLAQALRVPVADGVLTVAADGYAYASLEVALPGLDLPDMRKSDYRKVAARYPEAAAAILAFDYWIGNRDRGGNIKAAMLSEHLPLFRAFDHQFALLDVEQDPARSVERLKSTEPIVKFHPFQGLVEKTRLEQWLVRIACLPDDTLRNCCVFGQAFRTVLPETQEALYQALSVRSRRLSEIIPAAAMRP
ncbi:hypothetical protein AB6Q56_23130 (plasmid) [Dechloromonas sp. ARDL1]|uniref:HipA domain-containing protein n=1 Tax=Dechloromonas sp. ARDL1 TaxID=3322121 RepID=UPI001117918E